MPYVGNSPASNFASVTKDTFSGDGSTTAFTLSKAATTNGVAVFVENVRQEPTTAYAVSGTTLTFTAAPVSASGNNIYVLHHNAPASTATHPSAQNLLAVDGTFSGDVSVGDDLTVTDDILLSSDGAIIKFGADADVSLTHVADQGLTLTSTATDGAGGLGPILNLSTGDTDITAANQLGTINFQAPNDDAGSDAQLVAASITAIANSNFSSSSNATSLLLRSSNSGTNDGGYLEIKNTGTIRLQGQGTDFANLSLTNTDNLSIDCPTTDHAGITFGTSEIFPRKNEANSDDGVDLGAASIRFDDIHATNGTIQTSDQNEKQDIASATAKELNVAKKLSSLFKTFRWKSKVEEKGDNARTHTGIIAQEIQSAFSAEGLDASKYGLFISHTWWEKDKDVYNIEKEAPSDAIKRTRLGVRYPELFSFIFSSIEARLTALESK